MKQFACLGNAAETFILILVHGRERCTPHSGKPCTLGSSSNRSAHTNFFTTASSKRRTHSFPTSKRADVHLRIGRALLASLTADQLAEHLFDVANQLNRGAALLVDRDEKTQVATIDLRAGRKAKASAAYASARVLFLGRHGAVGRKRLEEPV